MEILKTVFLFCTSSDSFCLIASHISSYQCGIGQVTKPLYANANTLGLSQCHSRTGSQCEQQPTINQSIHLQHNSHTGEKKDRDTDHITRWLALSYILYVFECW